LRTFGVLVPVLCAALSLAGCSDGNSMNQKYFGGAAASMGGDGAEYGQIIDFTAGLQSDSPGTITLLSAELIPLPGFRTPKLVHLTVVTGCGLEVFSSNWGWPPRISVVRGGIAPDRVFNGARVWTGIKGKGCQSVIIYGVVASAWGPYACGGLLVTFKTSGGVERAPIFNGGYAWYHPAHPTAEQLAEAHKRGAAENNAAFKALNSMVAKQGGP